jgi:uncharacterized membrane protein
MTRQDPIKSGEATDTAESSDPVELLVARLLTIGTIASIALLAIGSVLLAARGGSPLDAALPLDVGRLPTDIAMGRPDGFLWLGLIAAIATPCARVAASLIGYIRRREPAMALVAVLILAVIALTVALAGTTGA